MITETMQASTFKARCLSVLDQVAATHREVVITKHGRAIARVVPMEPAPTTMGSVTLLADDDESFFSTGELWDAEA